MNFSQVRFYICELCDFLSPEYTKRNKHLEAAHHVCYQCDFQGKSYDEVNLHCANIHPKKVGSIGCKVVTHSQVKDFFSPS